MTLAELQLIPTPVAEIVPMEQLELARQKLRAEYQQIVAYGQTLAVTDTKSCEEAVQVGRLLQTATKAYTEFYKPAKQAYDAAKKRVLAQEAADLDEIKAVKDKLAALVLTYQTEQQRLHEEAMRAARAAAAREDEERRLAEAIELESMGLATEAQELLSEQVLPSPVIMSTAIPKRMTGSVTRTTWKAQVENFPALVKAVAAGKVPILALQPDQAWLDRQATDYNDGLQYPGVTVHKEVKSHFRS